MADCFGVTWGFLMLCIPVGLLVFFAYEAHVFIPSITRAYNYVPARMTVHQIDLSSRHCCYLVCFCDEVDDAKAETCSAMKSRTEALSPALCPTSNGSSLCPPTGSAAVCNDGPFCCTSCNNTCSSQSPSVCKCPCSKCGTCSCCKHVEGRLCRLFCDPCYNVTMAVVFTDRHGMPQTATILYSAGSRHRDAQDYYSEHMPNSAFLGFYKPSDPTVVHISRGYRVRKWATFIMLSALPFFLIAIGITGLVTAGVLVWMGRDVSAKVVFWVNWVFWVGIIWPFLILLLILELAYPTPRAKTALRILIPLMACIGWAPALLVWFCSRR
ncbi:hypothetical protein GOP47_0011958 [Adiantum capillus-veneris]|uniref:Uncharacterized protein n=1 Tax=Adiantum capillus-veneris TaxID=13818 RepID=A0A9D4ZI64_ADICA|nr:hypothetical protein GOP47_0011958 [Adiantum capillus-veneris]